MGCSASSAALRVKSPKVIITDHQSDKSENFKQKRIRNRPNKPVITKKEVKTESILTEHQKILIRQTWDILTPKHIELGSKILLRIFEKNSDILKIFSFSKVQASEDIQNQPIFNAHAMRFIQIIQSSVDNIDDLENGLIPVILNLGRFHQRKDILLEPEYLEEFLESAIYYLEKELGETVFTKDTKDAWIILFHFIITWMKEGYSIGK